MVADILGQEHSPAEYHAVPRVTFTDPEIGLVGLTEARAREQGLDVKVGMSAIPESTRGWIQGEVLSALTVAVHARVPVRRLREMIYAYPTFHRAIEAALAGLG